MKSFLTKGDLCIYEDGRLVLILNENVSFAESEKMGRRYPHVWCLVHDQKENRTRVIRGDYLKLLSKGKKSNAGQY
jgi:hypothetical protein